MNDYWSCSYIKQRQMLPKASALSLKGKGGYKHFSKVCRRWRWRPTGKRYLISARDADFSEARADLSPTPKVAALMSLSFRDQSMTPEKLIFMWVKCTVIVPGSDKPAF